MYNIVKKDKNDAIYNEGLNCFLNKDYKQAYKLFCEASKKGSSEATFMLGICHYEGLGTIKSVKKALELLKNAATNGNINAICSLGEYYYDSNNEYFSYDEAFKWNMIAANLNCRNALYLVGCSYIQGHGVTKSIPIGIYWLNRAAGYGHIDAIKKLLK